MSGQQSKKWRKAESERNKRSRPEEGTAMEQLAAWIALILGTTIVLNIVSHAPGASLPSKARTTNKRTVPEVIEAAQRKVQLALKDPAMTEHLIEQLRDPSATYQLTNDPEIIQNLRRLTNAVEAHRAIQPANWVTKAIHERERDDQRPR